ncbi:MAG: SGNH/GDSL hydrolase family protein [Kineosporiaceae bacterium]|nr:SGNH/GDSL hydrolase family protein [Kineosporiaceae bacterium]
MSRRLGWVASLDAQGGTGYLNAGRSNSPKFTPFKGRLASDVGQFRPDLVVIDGGRNDRWAKPDDLVAAARAYLRSVRQARPQARIIVVLPTFLSRRLNVEAEVTRVAIRSAAVAEQVAIVDPLAAGIADRADEPGLVSSDGVHPRTLVKFCTPTFLPMPCESSLDCQARLLGRRSRMLRHL